MAKHTTRKFNNRKRLENNRILSRPMYLGEDNIPTSVTLVQYDKQQSSSKILPEQAPLKSEMLSDKVYWFKITGLSNVDYITSICKEFGLHSFDVKDLMADQRVAKVALYDDVTFVLMTGFYLDEVGFMDDMQVAYIVGKNYIVSLQEASIPVFDDIEKVIIEKNLLFLEKGADYLLFALFSAINTLNMNTVMRMEDGLIEIEDRLIDQQTDLDIQHHLRRSRLDYTHLKRSIVSFREEYNNLLHNTNKLVEDKNLIYFNGFDDRLRTTLGNVESLFEALMSLLDVYSNNNNFKLNEIMKRLTIVSTIFIPLTFMVGVWGMNFKYMPELALQYGYFISWGVFILMGCLAVYWMKKKRWF